MNRGQRSTLLYAGRLIDGTGDPPRADMAVLVEDGVIRKIAPRRDIAAPADVEVIDLGDRTVLPGIIDAHMHFFGVPSHEVHKLMTESEVDRALRAAGEARRMLEAGITSARCLGSSIGPSLRRAINDGHLPGPRLVAAGEFICSTSGTWDRVTVPIELVKGRDMLADGIDGVREIVRRRVRSGANVIKIGLSKGGVDDRYHSWGDDPDGQVQGFTLEEAQALVDEAHLNKLRVSAHCIGDEAVRTALDSGVDTIEHGYMISDDTRKRVADTGAIVVSTISQLAFHAQAAEPYRYPAWMRDVYARHAEAMRTDFRKGLDAGIRYALGTDLVGYPTHPQDQAAKEFELAVDWGMGSMSAIVAGTKTSAIAIGMDHLVGTLEEGKLADIIAVSGNPDEDVRTLQTVEFVMQGGDVIVGARPVTAVVG